MAISVRKLIIPASVTSVLAVAGAAYALQVTHYRNVPGPVTGTYDAGIQGSFQIDKVLAPAGIPSAPSGGACLAFRASDLGYDKMAKIRCTGDEQCSTSENPNGYCEMPQKKCWARPVGSDSKLCKKMPTGAVAGVNYKLPVSHGTLTALSVSPHAKVRVLTLLKSLPEGSSPRLEWGTPKQL